MQDGKTNHGLINDRTKQENWFETGLTSQTTLRRCFQRTISVGLIRTAAILATHNRFRTPSLEFNVWERVSVRKKQTIFNPSGLNMAAV